MKVVEQFKYRTFLFHKKVLDSDVASYRLLKAFLLFASYIWKAVAAFKYFAIKFKIFPVFEVRPVVVSIGNIVAGGTGKTPLTISLLEALGEKYKLGLLSRGYGEVNYNPFQPSSDEPKLIQKKFPNLHFFIGRNRVLLANEAEKRKIDLLIMDDGMQHRYLNRDIELVTLNAKDLFGYGYFLPRGFLRDSPKTLKDADAIFLNHVKTEKEYKALCKNVRTFTKAPVIGMNPVIHEIMDVNGNVIDIEKNKKIGIFCGIANPENFKILLQENQASVVSELFLADHEKISEKKLERFAHVCIDKGAKYLLCTEKDVMPFFTELPIPVGVVKMKLQFNFGTHHWDNIVEKILNRVDTLRESSVE
ncbi:MAG: tetraacyldisaccharide 4'-kinase [Chlamydiae bacterium CG10_big_fil_rev_8_21_14_0_10_35_9]|nr:MAG: tetraacyldisaccharide 4'-kinase [Chlamydiae bacterium CG10_big_fil_rev_8_21_14_0_10_35_9]